MANEKKKVTNTNNKNKKTTAKKSTTTKTSAAKKTATKKNVTAKKETPKNAATTKTAVAKTTPKKKTTAAKKATTVTTKKAAKKAVNNTKNTTKKAAPKKNVKKQAPKKVENKVVETKKSEKKVEAVKEEPKKVEKTQKVASRKTEKKITLSTSTIYTIVGLVVLAIVIILSICINPSSGKYLKNDVGTTTNNGGSPTSGSGEIPEEERKELTSITIDQYLEKLKGEEASVIYIGRPTCSHCVAQKPIMENIVFEYDVTINYLNTDDLDDDGINKLVSSNEYFSEGFGTPLTLIVKNNEIVDKAVGETSKTDMVNMFKNNSIIK